MNLWILSWAYLRFNPLTTLLNVVLLALGIATIVILLLFSHQLEQTLSRNSQGIDLVVGAKGSPLQLILSSIYHADVPTGNIPLAEAEKWQQHRLVKQAIPLALGDSYQGFRIVGTTVAYPQHYQAQLAQGAYWQQPMQAVLGAAVARHSGLTVGNTFVGTHGIAEIGEVHAEHPYTITGILKPTHTVLDSLVLTDVASVWAVHDHDHAEHEHHAEAAHEHHDHAEHEHHAETAHEHHDHAEHEHHEPHKDSLEITALLLQYQSPLAAVSLPRLINSESALQAASPAFETARLLQLVGIGVDTLRIFGGILIIAAGLGVFIALYNALRERRYDLAVMRSLGASKWQLFSLLLLEGILISLLGALLGIGLGHGLTALLASSDWFSSHPLPLNAWIILPEEFILLGFVLLVGICAALLPAIQATRIEIARMLAEK